MEIGHAGRTFAFDNERPRHNVFATIRDSQSARDDRRIPRIHGRWRLPPAGVVAIARLVDRAGARMGGAAVLVPERRKMAEFTLGGLRPLNADEPVCHVSYFEADAFARWSGARLPTEAEWEHAAARRSMSTAASWKASVTIPAPVNGDDPVLPSCLATCGNGRPAPTPPIPAIAARGRWANTTASSCAINMCCAADRVLTPASHMRATYRNFFPPDARWQFSGFRLARDEK